MLIKVHCQVYYLQFKKRHPGGAVRDIYKIFRI